MSLTYTYTDALLKGRITEVIEARAIAEIEGREIIAEVTFGEESRQTLVPIRAYIIAATENATGGQQNDPYLAKISAYSRQYSEQEAICIAKEKAGAGPKSGASGFFVFNLERC
jgi:hypothetical protein